MYNILTRRLLSKVGCTSLYVPFERDICNDRLVPTTLFAHLHGLYFVVGVQEGAHLVA